MKELALWYFVVAVTVILVHIDIKIGIIVNALRDIYREIRKSV